MADRRQDDLGIRMTPERMARSLELGAQVLEVVDLPVVGDHEPTVRGFHRLMTVHGQVHDRETTVTERYAGSGIDPGPSVVGPTVDDRPGHPFDDVCAFVPTGTRTHESRDPAHISASTDPL